VKSARWRRGPGHRGFRTSLLIVVGLMMAVPIAGATGILTPNAGRGAATLAPQVASGTTCVVGSSPEFDAYDPVDHDVYVPNFGSGNLSVLTGACKLVGTVTFPKGSEPFAAAFNPTNNRVYVTDYGRAKVYVISGTKLVDTISSTTFAEPVGVTFDPGDAVIAVANLGSDTVTFLSGTIVAFTTTVGIGPELMAYDPYFGRLLVANTGTANVTSLNAIYPSDEADNINIPVGDCPVGIAFDYATSADYVTNQNSNNVTVITGIGQQLASIPVGSEPHQIAWDQAKLSVYVANLGSSTVSVIQGYTVVKTLGVSPSTAHFNGITYDEATDQVLVTAFGTGEVYVYS